MLSKSIQTEIKYIKQIKQEQIKDNFRRSSFRGAIIREDIILWGNYLGEQLSGGQLSGGNCPLLFYFIIEIAEHKKHKFPFILLSFVLFNNQASAKLV